MNRKGTFGIAKLMVAVLILSLVAPTRGYAAEMGENADLAIAAEVEISTNGEICCPPEMPKDIEENWVEVGPGGQEFESTDPTDKPSISGTDAWENDIPKIYNGKPDPGCSYAPKPSVSGGDAPEFVPGVDLPDMSTPEVLKRLRKDYEQYVNDGHEYKLWDFASWLISGENYDGEPTIINDDWIAINQQFHELEDAVEDRFYGQAWLFDEIGALWPDEEWFWTGYIEPEVPEFNDLDEPEFWGDDPEGEIVPAVIPQEEFIELRERFGMDKPLAEFSKWLLSEGLWNRHVDELIHILDNIWADEAIMRPIGGAEVTYPVKIEEPAEVVNPEAEPTAVEQPSASTSVVTAETTAPENWTEANVSTDEQPTLYVVQRGDSFWKIAKKFYGDGKLWPIIYEANEAFITEPRRLFSGMILIIPEIGGEISF